MSATVHLFSQPMYPQVDLQDNDLNVKDELVPWALAVGKEVCIVTVDVYEDVLYVQSTLYGCPVCTVCSGIQVILCMYK